MDDFHYSPSIAVARSARAFIRTLCEHYGAQKGMAVWDHIRAGLGDEIASDIFMGTLQGTGDVRVVNIDSHRMIHAIKEVRHATGMSLKEAKDFVEKVRDNGPQILTADRIGDDERVSKFINAMSLIGCQVE